MHAHPRGTGRAVVATLVALLLALVPAGAARADAAADEVAAAVNAERSAAGLGGLHRDAALDAAAAEWARVLSTRTDFVHSTNAWRQSMARPGWTSCCGENIAAGYGTSAAVMAGWMASSGHRANILGSGYSHLGVGHVAVPGTRYTHYWVQVFATYPFDRAGHEAFVRTLYRHFLGREASSAEVSSRVQALATGVSRRQVTDALSRSDEWLTSVITGFYRDTLGRQPDPTGLANWIAAARAGTPIAQIAASFYGSAEYFGKAGGTSEAWVRDLYDALLGRSADPRGLAGWVRALESGTSRRSIALGFYQSPETLHRRVDHLYRHLLGRPAEPGGLRTWAPVVRDRGDLALAATLATSDEYFRKAT